MLPPYLFWAILLLATGYALWHGRGEERVIAAVCLAASVTTPFVLRPLSLRYQAVEPSLVIIDLVVLAIFLAVALRSNRFWPLWVAGLQLTMSTSHALKAIELDLMPRAYAAAAIFWSYPILLILVIGTWRGARRRRRGEEQGMASEPVPA